MLTLNFKKSPLFTQKKAPVFIQIAAGLWLASGIIALILGIFFIGFSVLTFPPKGVYSAFSIIGAVLFIPLGIFLVLNGIFSIIIAYGLSYLKKWALILLTLSFPLSLFLGGWNAIFGVIFLVYCWKNKELFGITTFKTLIISLIFILSLMLLIIIGLRSIFYLLFKTEVPKEKTEVARVLEKPYIEVISPNGGETLIEGKTYEIKWRSLGVKKVNIEYIGYGDGENWIIVQDLPADMGKYSWQPEGIIQKYERSEGKLLEVVSAKIGILDAQNKDIFDKSDNYFNIVEDKSKVYPTFELNVNIQAKLDEKLSEISEIYREVKKDPDLSYIISGTLSDSFGFEYQNNRYILSSTYSGGAHCCGEVYVFRIDEKGELKLLKTTEAIWPGGNTSGVKLKLKNGKLYLVTTDDRFAYYPGSYAGSPFFMRYFLIEKDRLTIANIDWKEEFIEAAQDAEERLKNFYEEIKMKKKEYVGWETWTQPLIQKVVNYMVAREDEKAWANFDEDFEKFSQLIPPTLTAQKVKWSILKIMEAVPY